MTLPMDPEQVRDALKQMNADTEAGRKILRGWETHGSARWGLGVAVDLVVLERRLERIEAHAKTVMNWISKATSLLKPSSEDAREILAGACIECWEAYETDHDAAPAARVSERPCAGHADTGGTQEAVLVPAVFPTPGNFAQIKWNSCCRQHRAALFNAGLKWRESTTPPRHGTDHGAEPAATAPVAGMMGKPDSHGTGKQTAPPCVETDGASHPAGRHSLPSSGDTNALPRDVPRPDTKGKATSGPGFSITDQIAAVKWCYNRAAESALEDDEPTIQGGVHIPKTMTWLLSRLYAELSDSIT